MSLVGHALKMAKIYYSTETFNHAMRVAAYVAENPLIPYGIMDDCIALAIMHDLWEDTKYPKEDTFLGEHISRCLELLTKENEQNYVEYIDAIKSSDDKCQEAYWVKIAYMKDHLSQTDTLTDKLKKKYLATLAHLL